MKLTQILNEVFLLGRPSNGDTVIAHKQWVWVVNDETFDDFKEDINRKLHTDLDDIYDLQEIVESEPDIIVGEIAGNTLEIRSLNFNHSSTSKALMKVLKALRLQSVTVVDYDEYDNEKTFRTYYDEFKRPLNKQAFYHGTTVKALDGILSKGLMPRSTSNWDKIVHEDKVFLTTETKKASFHAIDAARKQEDFPVVIEFKIPDTSKLVADYDVVLDLMGNDSHLALELGYADIAAIAAPKAYRNLDAIERIKKRQGKKLGELSTKLGIFGYKGRIPTTHINNIYIDEENYKAFYLATEHWGELEPDYLSRVESVDEWVKVTKGDLQNLRDEVNSEVEDEWDED